MAHVTVPYPDFPAGTLLTAIRGIIEHLRGGDVDQKCLAKDGWAAVTTILKTYPGEPDNVDPDDPDVIFGDDFQQGSELYSAATEALDLFNRANGLPTPKGLDFWSILLQLLPYIIKLIEELLKNRD